MTTLEILLAARAKIEKPECWTQRAFARNRNQEPVSMWSCHATCWCATGAISAVSRDVSPLTAWNRAASLLNESARQFGFRSAFFANDSSDHAGVLAMFDRAIEAEREKAA